MRKRTNLMILLLITLVIVSCSFVNKDKTLIKLIIAKVDLETETPFKINCQDYDSYFKNEIKKDIVTDGKKLQEFSEIVKSLKVDPEKYMPDVRCKILLIYTNRTDTLCLSRLGMELNGNAIIFNNKILNYIK